MNRLGFADFHSKHFGPEQKAHWQSMLHYMNQQYYYSEQQQEEQKEEEDYEEEVELSKEAIEIFRFSEAYRKEREEERLKQDQDGEQEGMKDWQYDESTVLVSGGIEAPATSLVLTSKAATTANKSNKIMIQEELLNSAYLKSCTSSSNDTPVILWPVLPFKM